ncbi:Flp pilus assembly protein TadD, contains TPR repeats [Rhizobiales bacterium GAS188]|nr:Flp pilus assembly protein TadD, contains TPR repeats [Rhizobiales bacterium GAS188]
MGARMPAAFQTDRQDSRAAAELDGERLAAAIREAIAHLDAGQPETALAQIAPLAEIARASDAASYLFGIIHAHAGQKETALAWYEGALALAPDHRDVHLARANLLGELGRHEDAVAAHEGALRAHPEDAELWLNRSDALARLGRNEEALASCEACLALRPAFPEALYRRGVLQDRLGRLPQACASYQEALRLQPAYPEALCNLARILHRLGDAPAALTLTEEALRHRPDFLPALLNQANLLYQLGRLQDAILACKEALLSCPGEPKLLRLLGTMLRDLGQLDEAESAIDAAIARAPDDADAWMSRAIILRDRAKLDQALAAYETALRLRPAFPEALSNCGVLLRELGRVGDSIRHFDLALALKPDYPDARNNRAGSLLLSGRLQQGFEDFEARWQRTGAPQKIVAADCPEWRGETLEGRKLLVLDEQGLGDLIHMARYLPLLVDRGAEVTLICRKSMQALLRSLRTPLGFLDAGDAAQGFDPKAFDYQIAVTSLPRAFGTTLTSIPCEMPYLRAEPDRVARWAQRIGEAGIRIGLCWQGNIGVDGERAIPAEALGALAGQASLRFVSLMRDEPPPSCLPVETLGVDFDAGPGAFLDAAAVIACLDLVVTCDTAIAHLAGALGKPAFLLLKHVPDWRWLLGRQDSPWYPGMRLFRQAQRGEWGPVLAAVRQELQCFAASFRRAPTPTSPLAGEVGA